MEGIRAISSVGSALEARCEMELAVQACRQARAWLALEGLPEAELNAWELALVEAASNAVKHCPAALQQLPIRLEMLVRPESVEVRVVDHTPGFDWPARAELPPDDSESGRGIFLIQNLTDESVYLRGPGENCLVLRKARTPPGGVSGIGKTIADAGHQELQRTLGLMTEELASTYESLSSIFRFSTELQAGNNSEDFVNRWLKELLGIAEANWFVFRLFDERTQQLRLAATSLPDWTAEPILATAENLLESKAAGQRKDAWFDADTPLSAADPLRKIAPAGCGFAHALFVNDSLLGVLTIGRNQGGQSFRAGQVNVVQTFGDFLGLQIRSTQMQEEQVRARVNLRDLEIATNIQHALLPEHLPATATTKLAGFYRSARQIGGDYFDALSLADDSLLLVIADVMGKGLPAALFTFMFRSLVRARRDLAARPGVLLSWLNQNLFEELNRAEMFITAMIVHLDSRRGQLRLAVAAHPPLLIALPSGEVAEVAGDGLPLGVDLQSTFAEECHPFTAGHAVLFTDGLVEARNRQGDQLGLDAVKSALAAAHLAGDSAESARDRFARLLQTFEDTNVPADDVAFIVMAHL